MITLLNNNRKTKSQVMTEKISQKLNLLDNVKSAIENVNREDFVPSGLLKYAYELDALPISGYQWISSPLTVAKMTMALEPIKVDSVLEIGCGSGYQASILSKLFRRVFTIERVEKLYLQSKVKFKDLGFTNINLKLDDGKNGWSAFAPYDRIIFSASIEEVPNKIFDQLSIGGILVAPIQKNNKQIITIFKKNSNSIIKNELDECLFVPVKDGIDKS